MGVRMGAGEWPGAQLLLLLLPLLLLLLLPLLLQPLLQLPCRSLSSLVRFLDVCASFDGLCPCCTFGLGAVRLPCLSLLSPVLGRWAVLSLPLWPGCVCCLDWG